MEIIKDLGKPLEGGCCALCGDSFNNKFMRRLIIEVWNNDIDAPVAEPYNLCNSCHLKIK